MPQGRRSDISDFSLQSGNPQGSYGRRTALHAFPVAESFCRLGERIQSTSRLLRALGRQSPLPIVFNHVIQAEVRRKYVFRAEEAPTIFGEPSEWLSYLIQSLTATTREQFAEAISLRGEALERAPAISGTLNGEPFSWFMDGDSRVSIIIEVIINGQYYWVPQSRLRGIRMEPPSQARDAVWAAATLTLENASEISAFIPVRYPGAQDWTDSGLKLARHTTWDSPVENFYLGSGQRVWMTDNGEFPILETREIVFNPPN